MWSSDRCKASATNPAWRPAAESAMASPADPPEQLDERPPSWQQRIEQSPVGRGILSTLIVITLIAIVAINLPGSALRSRLLRPAQPYLNALGLDQNWALFAPDPRQVVIDVSALVSYEDGARRIWRFPHDGALIGAYRDYRWRKWAENLIDPANGAALWRPAALWAAAREERPAHQVTEVRLVERYHAIAPPGVSPSAGRELTRVFFTLRLGQFGGAA